MTANRNNFAFQIQQKFKSLLISTYSVLTTQEHCKSLNGKYSLNGFFLCIQYWVSPNLQSHLSVHTDVSLY